MRHEQSVQTQVETSTAERKKSALTETTPTDKGSNWQFKILMVIIVCGVLMLVLKTLGIL